MGQRYANVLSLMYGSGLMLTTVDPKAKIEQSAQHFSTLVDIPATEKFDFAVDAHPNVGRLEILREFCERDIPYVIIEKPHASSMAESSQMLQVAAQTKTKVMLPFFRHFAEVFQPETLAKLEAGRLLSINFTAGAIGMGCNGIHLIDLASFLFMDEPISVFGQLDVNSIPSPRGPEFMDHGGLLVLNYPARRMTLSVNSKSTTGINTTLQFENGKIQICEQSKPYWTWWSKPSEHMSLPVFRTSMEAEMVPPVPYQMDLEKIIEAGLRTFLSGGKYPEIRAGHNTLKAIALGLASTQSGRLMDWADEAIIRDMQFKFT